MFSHLRKVVMVFAGVALIALGITLFIQAGVGVDPWTILTLGLSRSFSLTPGRAAQGIGLFLVGCAWIFFRKKPGFATAVNFYFVGFFLDRFMQMPINPPRSIVGAGAYLIAAVLLIGFGSALYIRACWGEGPIELVMLGISERTRFRPGAVRMMLDVIVTVIGSVLGGPLGAGTLVGALAVGPVVQFSMDLLKMDGGKKSMSNSCDSRLAGLIDHTLLKPEASIADVERLCQEAKEYGFCSVCINPWHIGEARKHLAGTQVKICTVIGFPLGASTTAVKAAETRDAVSAGAEEIDMVMNVGALRSGLADYVRADIAAVVAAAEGRTVKVILETALLSTDEKMQACLLAEEAGAHFVKTSTGFGPGGATTEDVALMRSTVGQRLGVKASGGIRNRETALRMVEAGASRLGLSAGIAVVTGAEAGQGKY